MARKMCLWTSATNCSPRRHAMAGITTLFRALTVTLTLVKELEFCDTEGVKMRDIKGMEKAMEYCRIALLISIVHYS